MVKTLFSLAGMYQPSVVFIDEVDSLLCARTENENESSRRIKTEFLCQMDGANTNPNERILLIGATNRPQELDDAALRRFVKKLYIPLPNGTGRREFIVNLIEKEKEAGNKYEMDEKVNHSQLINFLFLIYFFYELFAKIFSKLQCMHKQGKIY